MEKQYPRRVVIVVNIPRPPVGAGLARAFEKLGSDTRVFMSHLVNTPFDRYVIHTLNHLSHNLRILPKGVNFFEDHPLSHKEYRNRKFLELCREFKPDLVFLTRGLRFKLETLAALREFTTVFCWHTESEGRFPEIVPELPYYHHTYFFSSLSLERARALGFANTSLLLHALDTSLFYPLGTPQGLRLELCGPMAPPAAALPGGPGPGIQKLRHLRAPLAQKGLPAARHVVARQGPGTLGRGLKPPL